MNVILRKFAFQGAKRFKDRVEIEFETNINKYQNKDYVKTFMYDEVVNVNYNAIVGIIGSNTSGKTTILNMFSQYVTYVNTGFSPFYDPRFNAQKNPFNTAPISPQQMHGRDMMRSQMQLRLQAMLGPSTNFNSQSECIEIYAEFVTDKMYVYHDLQFFRDGTFRETVHIKKRVNRNETRQQIFEKSRDNQINFHTFTSLLHNQDISINVKTNGIDNNDFIYANNTISTMGVSILDAEEIFGQPFMKLSSHPFLCAAQSPVDFEERVLFMGQVIKAIDPNVKTLQVRSRVGYDQKFYDLKFILQDDTVIREQSLSTGTVKFASVLLNMVTSQEMDQSINKYILIDEIDNSWHPNLTRIFIRLFKLGIAKHLNLICTFHNPYIASEFREDALYVTPLDGPVQTRVDFINDYNKKHPEVKLRLEHNFAKKYLDEIVCSGPENLELDQVLERFEKYEK